MQRQLGITVQEALRLEQFKNARIVAGESGLNRVIKSVNIMEVPDIAQWVKEGEFLLTTIYAIKDDEEAQRRLIPALAARGLAGIAIKPGRYIEEIPDMMIEQANQHEIPLIELPFHAAFSDLMDPVLSEILNVQAVFLQQSLDTHEQLMEVVLTGGGLKEIATSLAKLIGNPVVLLNQNMELLEADFLGSMEQAEFFEFDELARVWQLKKEMARKGEKAGRFRKLAVSAPGRELCQFSIPVMSNQEIRGYIMAWEWFHKVKDVDLLSIERAVTVTALEILNLQTVFEVERRYRNDLLHDLLNGRFESEEIVTARAKTMQWNLNLPMSVIIFEMVTRNPDGGQREEHIVWNRILRGINQMIETHREQIILGEWGTKVVLLHTLPDQTLEAGSSAVNEYLGKTVTEVQRLTGQYQQKCFIGVGTVCRNIWQWKQGYQEAREALKVAKTRQVAEKAFFYERLGIYKLLHKIPARDLQTFLEDTLAPLINYDEEHNTELVKTLDLYFAKNGNLRSLAKELYLHYNTILYRIERIQTILSLDLTDRDSRINLEVALKIYLH